jgi:hypothetical protein
VLRVDLVFSLLDQFSGEPVIRRLTFLITLVVCAWPFLSALPAAVVNRWFDLRQLVERRRAELERLRRELESSP